MLYRIRCAGSKIPLQPREAFGRHQGGLDCDAGPTRITSFKALTNGGDEKVLSWAYYIYLIRSFPRKPSFFTIKYHMEEVFVGHEDGQRELELSSPRYQTGLGDMKQGSHLTSTHGAVQGEIDLSQL
ncbi:hypothetical protein MN608_08958 [Microdochium nivale]|nr:hypothetical protein MN608_08958 [Microdochium nivale]